MADKKQNLVKYGEVVAKCWEDEAYRKRFIEDPESVLSEAGFKYLVLPHADAKDAVQDLTKAFLNQVEQRDVIIPDGAEVRIIQNTDDTRYMVLPASPKSLTKSELAAAAGGDSVSTYSNAVTMTNAVQTGEVATTVVEMQTASTTTTVEFEAEVGVVAVAVAVLV